MLQECQIPCHLCIHSFITQSFGRSSRALWTALCGSIHVAPPTLVLIDQQHANKGIHVAQFDSCGLGLGGTHTHTHFLPLSLSLSICAIEERHSRALKKRTWHRFAIDCISYIILLPCRASLDCIRTDTLVRLRKPDARRRRVGTLSFAIDMHARVKSLSDDTLGSISGGQLIMQLFESSKSIGGTSYLLALLLSCF